MRTVTCDQCSIEFNLKIKSKAAGMYEGEKVRLLYIVCTKCKHKYYIKVHTKIVDELIKEARQIDFKLKKLDKNGDRQEYKNLKNLFKKKREEAKRLSDKVLKEVLG